MYGVAALSSVCHVNVVGTIFTRRFFTHMARKNVRHPKTIQMGNTDTQLYMVLLGSNLQASYSAA